MTEFTSVREGRHAARDALETAHTVLTARLESALGNVDAGLHDALRGTTGAKGLSQQEQVTLLDSMIDSCDKIDANLADMVTALQEAASATANDVRDAITRAREALVATKELAAQRDFEKWQAEKPEPTEEEVPEGLDPIALLNMLFGGQLPAGEAPDDQISEDDKPEG